MDNEKRFVKVYAQGGFIDNSMTIYVDRLTGVNYLYSQCGNSAGLTVLVDRDGKPIVSPLPIKED